MIEERDKEIKTLQKALELACSILIENINKYNQNLCDYCISKDYNIDYGSCVCDDQFWVEQVRDYFIKQAKENKRWTKI